MGGGIVFGCDPGTMRPAFRPFPESYVDTVIGLPDSVTHQIAERLRAEGLQLRRFSPRDGFLETREYDVVAGRHRNTSPTQPARVVIFRFWADPAFAGTTGGQTRRSHTQITAEVVHRRTADPSLPPRDAEVFADPDHPATALLERLLRQMKDSTDSG